MTTTGVSTPQQKVWFITGASSGFGRLLAEHLLKRGDAVVATARKPEQLKDLARGYPATSLTLKLDVTKSDDISKAMEDARARFGHIDVLVNNAGYGVIGAIEEVGRDEFMPMYETNVFGLIALTKAALPEMRERRSGTIVNLSSIGGLIAGPGFGYYASTKFCVEGLSEALRAEVEPLGIHVIVIEPGPFRTDFLGRSAQEARAVIADYIPTAGKAREYNQTQAGKQPGDPQKAVEAIIAAVEAPEPPKQLLLGKSAITRYRAKLEDVKKNLDTWESTSVGADFPAGE
jgi:NAD(P)-dependent dehydrogenase (short-subunit alcohol dehydrogenase family)